VAERTTTQRLEDEAYCRLFPGYGEGRAVMLPDGRVVRRDLDAKVPVELPSKAHKLDGRARLTEPGNGAEMKVSKATLAVLLLCVGSVVTTCGLAGWLLLTQLEWVRWTGAILAGCIFACGLAIVIAAWNWWRVLRD
jgi:hypothetical protein